MSWDEEHDEPRYEAPSRLPHEGPCAGMRCPRCGSGRVECVSALYDLSKLACGRCGHAEIVDEWQIDSWFDPLVR